MSQENHVLRMVIYSSGYFAPYRKVELGASEARSVIRKMGLNPSRYKTVDYGPNYTVVQLTLSDIGRYNLAGSGLFNFVESVGRDDIHIKIWLDGDWNSLNYN